jgi:hypothetical protein
MQPNASCGSSLLLFLFALAAPHTAQRALALTFEIPPRIIPIAASVLSRLSIKTLHFNSEFITQLLLRTYLAYKIRQFVVRDCEKRRSFISNYTHGAYTFTAASEVSI